MLFKHLLHEDEADMKLLKKIFPKILDMKNANKIQNTFLKIERMIEWPIFITFTAWKVSVFGVVLVRIFSHSGTFHAVFDIAECCKDYVISEQSNKINWQIKHLIGLRWKM